MSANKPKISVDDILSGLDKIDLKESLYDTYSNQTYLPILKDRSVLNKFGTLTAEQLNQILKGSNLIQSATSPTKWDQHFFGPIKGSKVRLVTFLRNTPSGTATVASEMHTFYTNYTFLTEDVDVTPTDLSGRYIIASNGTSDAPVAYVQSPADPAKSLYVGRKTSGTYNSYTVSGGAPPTAEGLLVKSFGGYISNQVLQSAMTKVRSFSNPNEQAILDQIRHTTKDFPVLINSICYGLVDSLNIVTSATQSGTSKMAGNALLGHNYLTHAAFDETSLFSLSGETREEIKAELTKLVKTEAPYNNKWLPLISAFYDADKKARSASSLYRAILNMFFSSFGNIFSVVSKSVGYTTGRPMPLKSFIVLKDAEAKIKHTYSLLASNALYTTSPTETRLANPFIRVSWSAVPSGNSFYYGLTVDLLSLDFPDTDTYISGNIGRSKSADIKVARLPEQATQYLVRESIKNSGNTAYNEAAFLAGFSSAGTSMATVNAGNEDILRSILKTKINSAYTGAGNESVFSKQGEVFYAGLPLLFMQLAALELKYPIKALASDVTTLLQGNAVLVKDLAAKVTDYMPAGISPDFVEPNLSVGLEAVLTKMANKYTKDAIDNIPNVKECILEYVADQVDFYFGLMEKKVNQGKFKLEPGTDRPEKSILRERLGRVIEHHITTECEAVAPIVTQLLTDMYNPDESILTLQGSNPSYKKLLRMLSNLQSGVWTTDDKSVLLVGRNVVMPGKKILQLNEAVLSELRSSKTVAPEEAEEEEAP